MEITFQNKRSDLDAFYDYVLKQTQEGKQLGKQVFMQRQLWFILILALISALAWGLLSNLGSPLRNSLLTSVLLFVFMLGIGEAFLFLIAAFKPYYYFGRRAIERQTRLTDEDVTLFQLPKTLTVESDWLEVRTSEALHRWRWGLVDDIRLISDFIFLHVGKCHVYYIPKRDFSSEQDFVQFGNQLVALHRKHKDQHALVVAKS